MSSRINTRFQAKKIDRLQNDLKKLKSDHEDEILEYRNNMDKMKDQFLEQVDNYRVIQEKLEEENR